MNLTSAETLFIVWISFVCLWTFVAIIMCMGKRTKFHGADAIIWFMPIAVLGLMMVFWVWIVNLFN